MCLGIPMQIRAIDGLLARCEAKGVEREANLLMLEHEGLAVGDFVVVHLGYAVDRVTPEEAAAACNETMTRAAGSSSVGQTRVLLALAAPVCATTRPSAAIPASR